MCFSYMSPLNTQLQNLGESKVQKIRGISVRRENDSYFIDDTPYGIDDAVARIENDGKKRQGFPYNEVVFLLVKQPKRVISYHKIKSRSGHVKLLEIARKKKLLIYYADVEKRGKKFFAKEPWAVDFESVDDLYGAIDNSGKISVDPGEVEGIHCPVCFKPMKSTPGRTLHVKAHHPERYEEYMRSK